MKTFLLFFISGLMMVSGCCSGKNVTENSTSQQAGVAEARPSGSKAVLTNEKTAVNDLSVMDTWQNEMTAFAFRFFNMQSETAKGKGFCVSPVSLQVSLGMAYAGARTETAKQMAKALGFSEDTDQFLKEIGEYYSFLKKSETDTSLQFSAANRIYVEQTYKLLETYKTALKQYFGGSFETVDFLYHAPDAEDLINKWVEKNTCNRIKQLIPKGLLDSSTLMVLVNALYFKADWKTAFDETKSAKMLFYKNSKETTEKKFMKSEFRQLGYAKYRHWQVAEFQYKSPAFSFLVILPDESSAENIKERIPNAADYQQMLKALRIVKVYVEIPSFRIESSFELESMMKQMGMPLAFTDNADFSGIAGRRDIKISKILQKVFFEITEKGSEAAAATAVVMVRTTSVADIPDPVVNFIVNRPFIFILKENTYQTPLFIGQFTGNE